MDTSRFRLILFLYFFTSIVSTGHTQVSQESVKICSRNLKLISVEKSLILVRVASVISIKHTITGSIEALDKHVPEKPLICTCWLWPL